MELYVLIVHKNTSKLLGNLVGIRVLSVERNEQVVKSLKRTGNHHLLLISLNKDWLHFFDEFVAVIIKELFEIIGRGLQKTMINLLGDRVTSELRCRLFAMKCHFL
jgi:hypothetical protein